MLLDLHHASVDVDIVANLIKLPGAHNVGCHPRDEVHPIELLGLTVLAHKHDSSMSLDPRHRAIAETHSAEHCRVELHEHRLTPRLVVGHTGV
jgi:hypothetical protein